MIKLVVTDLDGTLLKDDHTIDHEFWEIAAALKANNIHFAAASGRQYHNIIKAINPIKEQAYVLAENGGYCVFREKVIHKTPLSMDDRNALLDIAFTIPDTYPILCGTKSAYYFNQHDVEQMHTVVPNFMTRLQMVADLRSVDDDIVKITIANFEDAEKIAYPHYQHLTEKYKIAIAGKTWVDITAANSNKGVAVKRLQEQLHVSYDETLVFGDYLNDLEMMGAAKYSYSMLNARPEIKEAANFITREDNNNKGVINIIKELCLS